MCKNLYGIGPKQDIDKMKVQSLEMTNYLFSRFAAMCKQEENITGKWTYNDENRTAIVKRDITIS